jgi:hypothetical protein
MYESMQDSPGGIYGQKYLFGRQASRAWCGIVYVYAKLRAKIHWSIDMAVTNTLLHVEAWYEPGHIQCQCFFLKCHLIVLIHPLFVDML